MCAAPRNPGTTVYDRRRFLQAAAATVLASRHAALQAQQKAESVYGKIKVTKIDTHEITVPYQDWIHDELDHFYGPTKRTIYQAHTNVGLTGLGESGSPEVSAVLEKYVGSNPFHWIGDETSLGLGTAMYDLMGKAAGIPVYRLFGTRQRRWVAVGSWTVSTDPERMARAVQKYSAVGYTWLKYHLSPFENVIDQLDAMQAVAPPGFRVQFDLTMGGTVDHTYELLEKISAYPIAGSFEDPLFEKDLDSYRELRQRTRLPVILHHSPLGATFEVLRRAADGYILGHAKIGTAMRRAGLFDAANLPFTLQNVGGQITRAMVCQMHAAFRTATIQCHNDTETWKDDVVKERLDPVNGFMKVNEKPGLGLTLDEVALQRLKSLQLPGRKKWIIKTTFKNGTKMYNLADPEESIFMVRPDRRRLVSMSYDSPLSTEYWDPDGTPEFAAMKKRIEDEGIVLE